MSTPANPHAAGGPLTGVRVLDLSRVLAGPFACQALADLGADVVKIERPGTGDDTRQWGPPFYADGTSAYFASCNRGKRSVAIDLSQPESKQLLAELVRKADVLVENFLPESAAKLGLAPDQLKQLNPRLVHCGISGFGRTGPEAKTPGYDLVIQAMSGLMAITGEPDGRPMKVGVAITDVLTGLYTAVCAVAGLAARASGDSSRGWSFDLSLLDCTLAGLVNIAQASLATGKRPARYGNAHPQIVPYESFATADGRLVLAVGNDGQFARFCQLIGHPEWSSDARFATNPARVAHRAELVPQIAAALAARSTADWLAALTAAGVPHGPVLALDEVVHHPQVAARRTIVPGQVGGSVESLVGSPIHLTEQPAPSATPPTVPQLGQHTEEVLREWLGRT